MCKLEETLVVTFRAKYPFFLGTAADAKAQPSVNPTLPIRRVLIDAVFIATAPTALSKIYGNPEADAVQMLGHFDGHIPSKVPFLSGHSC